MTVDSTTPKEDLATISDKLSRQPVFNKVCEARVVVHFESVGRVRKTCGRNVRRVGTDDVQALNARRHTTDGGLQNIKTYEAEKVGASWHRQFSHSYKSRCSHALPNYNGEGQSANDFTVKKAILVSRCDLANLTMPLEEKRRTCRRHTSLHTELRNEET